MTEREKFENWASMPPREWPIVRFDEDDTRYRSGDYCTPFVEYAWQAWQGGAEAYGAEIDEIAESGIGSP